MQSESIQRYWMPICWVIYIASWNVFHITCDGMSFLKSWILLFFSLSRTSVPQQWLKVAYLALSKFFRKQSLTAPLGIERRREGVIRSLWCYTGCARQNIGLPNALLVVGYGQFKRALPN
jgi:hypothetical protein